ncbi:hypothetical protein F8E02_03150 [Methanoculleus sp. Wushi-C6]|uniref:Uncharacterized protein n=1 Tax=Methanoculleus caldifontis TaxID=2651577 RepID=A0ABU3WYZ3_9EURY|nr:hypothetical protein [Methanoculleus sp. Wushi-C6]MDV2481020.1 hypothetical protein [Methanoculleus sp. Wushi-C6]
MSEEADLIVGSGRRVDGRCVIPIVRVFTVCAGKTAAVSLIPVALLVTEGDGEYLMLFPGAPPATREIVSTLRDDIERQKEGCAG